MMDNSTPPTSSFSADDVENANDMINFGTIAFGGSEYAAMTDEVPIRPNEGSNNLNESAPSSYADDADSANDMAGSESAPIDATEYAVMTDEDENSLAGSVRAEDRSVLSQRAGNLNIFSLISSVHKFKHSKDRRKQNDITEEESIARLEKLSEVLTQLAIDETHNAKQSLNYSQSLVNIDLTSSKNWAEIDEVLEVLLEQEFPKEKTQIPNLRAIINVGDLKAGARFSPGTWVEIRGADMKWRLDMITKVSKEAPADYDWNDPKNEGKEPEWTYFYQAGDERRLSDEDLRSPEQGLKHVFGSRPWIWQQWACLKLEQILRFQEGHQNDFTSLDVQRYATELWEYWLHHPSNQEFYDHFFDVRIGDYGRSELVDHIMTPFRLMDLMTSDHEAWDFEADEDISIYTYLGLFGSGFLIPFILIFIQLSVMLILLTDSDYKRDLAGEEMDGDGDNQDFSILAMAIVVMFLYLVKVVPDLMIRFYNTVGTADSVHSRLNHLSQELWLHDDDRIGQKIGFKMDSFMNTTYVAILYILNIYVIVNAENALDVILNSLALEFVEKIDELVSKSVWWDRKKRWIRAGALEIVLQATLQKHCLRSAHRFSEEFHVPVSVLNGICNYNRHLFYNEVLAADDADNPRLMTKSELIKSRCKDIAIRTGNRKAIQEYKKPVVYFSYLENMIRLCCSFTHNGLFERHYAFRTWSCWNQVLYYAPIPNLDSLFDKDEDGIFMLSKDLDHIVHTSAKPFANYDEYEESATMRFVRKFFEVIFFIDFIKSMRSSWQKNGFRRLLFHFFDGLLQWVAYVVQISFPFVALIILVALIKDIRREYVIPYFEEQHANSANY